MSISIKDFNKALAYIQYHANANDLSLVQEALIEGRSRVAENAIANYSKKDLVVFTTSKKGGASLVCRVTGINTKTIAVEVIKPIQKRGYPIVNSQKGFRPGDKWRVHPSFLTMATKEQIADAVTPEDKKKVA